MKPPIMFAAFCCLLIATSGAAASNDIQGRYLKDIEGAAQQAAAHKSAVQVAVDCIESLGEKRRAYNLFYDPTRQQSERWHLVKLEDNDQLDRVRSSLARRPAPSTYADVMKFMGTSPSRISQTGDALILRENQLGKEAVVINDRDVSEHFYADITITKKDEIYVVRKIKFHLKSPFSMGLAKIQSANGEMEFTTAQGIDHPVLSRSVFYGVFRSFLTEKTMASEEIYTQHKLVNN